MSIEGQGHFFTKYFPGLYVLCFTNVKISGERLQDQWSSGLKKYEVMNYQSIQNYVQISIKHILLKICGYIMMAKKTDLFATVTKVTHLDQPCHNLTIFIS